MFEAPALSPLTNVKMRFFGSVIVNGEEGKKSTDGGRDERDKGKIEKRRWTERCRR